MFKRIQKLSENQSYFLFGARGTGKTTLLHQKILKKNSLWIDLLLSEDEDRFGRFPDELYYAVQNNKNLQQVVIDEIQKAPKLLDIVHKCMFEFPNVQFIMTGSSARKLRHGAANLLAGRAFTYSLYPLTVFELGTHFSLSSVLEYGTLPRIFNLEKEAEKQEFLRSYTRTYLKEEIQVEQLVRKLYPFRDFLEIAAQSNGKIINFSSISKDIGVDDKTVKNYFSILEDTLLGFFLPAFSRSIRKQQQHSPKFYFFDLGVKRALDQTLTIPLKPKTYAFGDAFEHFVILECMRLNAYFKKDFHFSYIRTKAGVELDLVIQRPGGEDILVEIKSTDFVKKQHLKHLNLLGNSWDKPCKKQVWSLDKLEKSIEGVDCLFWEEALKRIFDECNILSDSGL